MFTPRLTTINKYIRAIDTPISSGEKSHVSHQVPEIVIAHSDTGKPKIKKSFVLFLIGSIFENFRC